MWKSAPSGVAGDAADDLPDEEPEGERVMAGGRSRLPFGRLRGRVCRHGLPVVALLDSV
jgi:hypothetical protein